MTWKDGGTGKGSDHSRIDKEKYDKNMEKIDWSKKEDTAKEVIKKDGKTTYKY